MHPYFDPMIRLIEAFSKLLGVISWPLISIVVFYKLIPIIQKFMDTVGEISIKGGGIEASGKRFRAASALAAAQLSQAPEVSDQKELVETFSFAQEMVNNNVTSGMIRHVEHSKILWFGDKENKSEFEKQAFSALGIKILLATTVEEAIEQINTKRISVIVSDIASLGNPDLDLELLDSLRLAGRKIPYILYDLKSQFLEHMVKAIQYGAEGLVTDPYELFKLILDAIRENP